MSKEEENNNTNVNDVTNQDQVVAVSEKEIETINNEIEKVDEEKISAAKEEGKKELLTELKVEELEKELMAIKQKNEEIVRKQEEEAKKAALLKEIEKEKAFQEQVNRKHVVPNSDNPVVTKLQQPAAVVQEPPEVQYEKFLRKSLEGSMSATQSKEDVL